MSQSTRSRLISILKITAQVSLAVGILGFLVWLNRKDLVKLWSGTVVIEVLPGSPASKVGLELGDVIISVGGQRITRFDELCAVVAQAQVGSSVRMIFERGGKTHEVELTIKEQPAGATMLEDQFGFSVGQQPKGWGFLAAGFVICLAATLMTFVRWCVLIWAQGLPFRLSDGLRIGFIGYLFNQIIPGAVSGDLVKAVLLAREQARRTVAIATVVIDRIVGMYGLALVAALATIVFWTDLRDFPQVRDYGVGVVVAASIGTVGFGLLFTPLLYRPVWTERIGRLPVGGHLMREILGAMAVYHGKRRVVLLTVVMSMAVHIGLVSSLFCAALALRTPEHPDWPARAHYVLAPIGLAINAIPLSPGGVGVGEGGMQFLFNSVGQAGSTAFAMMLAFRAMCWLISLVGVRFLVASFTETRRAIAEARPTEPAPVAVASAGPVMDEPTPE